MDIFIKTVWENVDALLSNLECDKWSEKVQVKVAAEV